MSAGRALPGERSFACHRAIAPALAVLAALATVELLVVHLLVSLWSRTAAIALSVVTLASILWLVRLIRSLRRMPVLLGQDRLVMRLGILRTVIVPRDRIAGVRRQWSAADLKAPGVVNLSRIVGPNVMLDIDPPLPGRRPVTAIAHHLDDPAAFLAALAG